MEKKTKGAGKPPEERAWIQKCLDVAGVILLVVGVDQKVRLINRKGCELLGYREEEIIGKDWFESFLPSRLREQVRRVFIKLTGGEIEPFESFENPVLTRTGEERLIVWNNTVLSDDDGRIIGTLSSGEDITERKKSDEALRRSEAELRALVETAVDGIVTIDPRGIIRSFNPAACRIFGYAADEVIGRNVGILMTEPDRSRHDQYISNYLTTREAKIIGIGRETLGRRKDGTTFPLYLAVSEVRLEDRVVFTAFVRDLTAFREMQEAVLQARNLAVIGEMAASVAHEVKNPLAGISGAIQVLMDTLEPADSRREVMQRVLGQVERLDNSMRKLLLLSKPWKPEKQSCDLTRVVRHVIDLAGRQDAFAEVRFVLQNTTEVRAPVDVSLLEQVLWNIILNAVQASKNRGEVRFILDADSEFAILSVEDSGSGIPPGLLKRVFRPFVTTKATGVGLGLSICKKIMDAHHGSISIESHLGQGSRVTLRFPKDNFA
ncbi:MAG: PAS domain S-box protein [Acidobacteriota bacterium]